MIIAGLEETIWGGEGDRAETENILREMKLSHRIRELNRVERIGKHSRYTRKRLIIASFDTRAAAFEIADKWYRLKSSRTYRNVLVRRDLSKKQREEEKNKGKPKEPTSTRQDEKNDTQPMQRSDGNNAEGRSPSRENRGAGSSGLPSTSVQDSSNVSNNGESHSGGQSVRPKDNPNFQGNEDRGHREGTT